MSPTNPGPPERTGLVGFDPSLAIRGVDDGPEKIPPSYSYWSVTSVPTENSLNVIVGSAPFGARAGPPAVILPRSPVGCGEDDSRTPDPPGPAGASAQAAPATSTCTLAATASIVRRRAERNAKLITTPPV